MAQFNITANQLKVAKQSIQNRHIWLELMNENFQVLDEISGYVTGGNLSINADSDIRRTCSITMVVKDSSFEVEAGGRIWLDKYIRVKIGTELISTGEIVTTNCGVFIVDAPSYTYNASTNTLSLSLLDLMAKLTGMRNGYLEGIPIRLEMGESIREAMIAILERAGITRYVIANPPAPEIPYDLDFDIGATVFKLLSTLRDLYPTYEIYFDVDGIFHYAPIPTGENDPVQMDDALWENIVIDEQLNVDFQNVKNSIEIFGRTHDPKHFSTETTVSSEVITLTIPDVEEYVEDVIYGFTLTNNTGINSPRLKINSLTTLPVLIEQNRPAKIDAEQGEVYYCVQYKGTYWRWIGHLQSYAKVEDTNTDSPFYIGGSLGKIRIVLFNGQYDNCFTDDLALQRAKYELYTHTQLQNTVNISCVNSAPFIDVNALVEYTLQRNRQKYKWLIKQVTYGFGVSETMTLTLMRFYPDYFYI